MPKSLGAACVLILRALLILSFSHLFVAVNHGAVRLLPEEPSQVRLFYQSKSFAHFEGARIARFYRQVSAQGCLRLLCASLFLGLCWI